MARHPGRVNVEWETSPLNWTWEQVNTEVLMDIRAELQRLNALLACPNFIGIPKTLRSINTKLVKPPKVKS